MFASLAFVFLFGLMGAAVFEKMKLPRIIGMLLVGILIGPYALGLLDPTILSISGDLRKLAHSLITNRVTTLVLNEYPNARWIWEAPNAFELIELGEEVYILLNRAGGYRKAKVIIQNLQVIGLQYQEIPKKPDESEERTEAPATEQPKENYELIAFEWAESHIFELNARCNDAIGQGLTEILLTADDLPARESWENVCLELQRAGLEDVECIAEGIKINLSH